MIRPAGPFRDPLAGYLANPLAAARGPMVAALLAAIVGAESGQAQADERYVIQELGPGVFAAVAPAGVPPYLFASSLVVIGEDGVLVVDSGQRPALAEQLIAHIRARTALPVRWVVNTHWHGDHVWGNAAFRAAYPAVEIWATPATRDSIRSGSRRQVAEQIERHRAARAELASMRDTADAALAARIEEADAARVARIEELEGLEMALPTHTFTERTELDVGGRTAVLLTMGPAHTPGDAAVWLPDLRFLAVGDLLEEGELWLEGADLDGWSRALDGLAFLGPRLIVASHGGVSPGGGLIADARAQIDAARAEARDTTALDSTAVLYSIGELDGPEAVRYDPEQDVFFVASFGEAGEEQRDANGYISRVSAADGAVESHRFMTGTPAAPLHMPRGMAIRGDTLWVADVDGVHGFDRITGAHAAFVDFTAFDPGFLNDVAVGPDGSLYVTDTGAGRVFRVPAGTPVNGAPEVALDGLEPGPPNGITWDPDLGLFLLAPWNGHRTLRGWDPATGEVLDVATLPGGRFDGIEVLADGSVLIASQDDTSLYRLDDDGGTRRVVRVPGRPADIGIDTRRDRVAVPYIALDRVDVWKLPDR